MSLWILVCAVVLAAYLIARAIESLSQTLKPSGSLSSDNRASMDERFIVSQIATTLIAAQFGNPLYTEGIKSLHDGRETICYDRIKTTIDKIAAASDAKAQLEEKHKKLDEILSNVDSNIYQSSVFFGGRTKFVQLAWDIYHDVCLTQREQTRIE
ncbi:MAG: hypothetical protein ACLPXT_15415 [Terracidiphilus sp.]